jgi:hypothetical protein
VGLAVTGRVIWNMYGERCVRKLADEGRFVGDSICWLVGLTTPLPEGENNIWPALNWGLSGSTVTTACGDTENGDSLIVPVVLPSPNIDASVPA